MRTPGLHGAGEEVELAAVKKRRERVRETRQQLLHSGEWFKFLFRLVLHLFLGYSHGCPCDSVHVC